VKIDIAVWKKRALIGAVALVALFVAASPWWGPHLLSNLAFFRMQRVEIHGLRYLAESELLEKLAVDTSQSIWMDLAPLRKRLEEHPQLLGVTVSRKLPGTLVVRVQERQPVAIVPSTKGFVAIDDSGATLPIDPASGDVDVPILPKADTALVRLLSQLKKSEPSLYQRVSKVSRVGKNELRIEMMTVVVLAMSDVTVQRLQDILPVERDLAAKGMKVAELDLRFFGPGQVIARPK
jgi:cell division protein FtsQ